MHNYEPLAHLDHLGVSVAYGGAEMEYSGIYVHEARLVVLRGGMSERLQRCVLAHEAVHAEHGDMPQWSDEVHEAIELRTDIIAARRLISGRQWERLRHLPTSEVCERLDVVPHVVEIHRRYSGASAAAGIMPLLRPQHLLSG